MQPTSESVLIVPGIEGKTELTVGVLADTHLPFRLKRLPGEIMDIFRGVDLILHAGDVDQLGVPYSPWRKWLHCMPCAATSTSSQLN